MRTPQHWPWTCVAVRPEDPQNGRKVLSLCGNFTDPEDIVVEDPTCPDCQAELRRKAGAVDYDNLPF